MVIPLIAPAIDPAGAFCEHTHGRRDCTSHADDFEARQTRLCANILGNVAFQPDGVARHLRAGGAYRNSRAPSARQMALEDHRCNTFGPIFPPSAGMVQEWLHVPNNNSGGAAEWRIDGITTS